MNKDMIYDPKTDILTVYLGRSDEDEVVSHSEISKRVIAVFGSSGEIVEMRFLEASKWFSKHILTKFEVVDEQS